MAAVGAVGTYAGALTLKQGRSDKITVEGKVGDFIGWPLIVVAIGALIGGYGVTRFERWRTRRILKAELVGRCGNMRSARRHPRSGP